MKLIPVMLAMAMNTVQEGARQGAVKKTTVEQIPEELLYKNESRLSEFIRQIDRIFDSTER